MRGDWAWYKQIFSFKGWASESICWRCMANKSDKPFWDFGLGARWRRHRMSPTSLMQRLLGEGASISPLFGAPGFCFTYITIDVLHCMDLGVSIDAMGNLFWLRLGILFTQRARVDQVSALFERLKSLLSRNLSHLQITEAHSRNDKAGQERA